MKKVGDNSVSDLSSKKAEWPPLLKRSKTSIPDDNHFAGPLFPAVRRLSPSPPSPPRRTQLPDLRVSVGSDNLSPAQSSGNSIGDSSFSDRDWVFPSFLGPHVTANRVTVKGRRVGGSGNGNMVVEEKKGIGTVASEKVKLKGEKIRVEKEVKTTAGEGLVTLSSSVTQSGGRSSRGILKHSLLVQFVSSFPSFLPFFLVNEKFLVCLAEKDEQ